MASVPLMVWVPVKALFAASCGTLVVSRFSRYRLKQFLATDPGRALVGRALVLSKELEVPFPDCKHWILSHSTWYKFRRSRHIWFRPYCTVSVVLVERTSEPVAAPEVPVTMMVYAPAGVPRLPTPLVLSPPQAT